jgi:peptidoglycan/LPS O-acetylase OafA/YrhL
VKTPAEKPIAVDFRKRLPALDGLRGIAILAVFFYHYAGGLPDRVPSGPLHLLGMVFAFGWSGVDLFFVLSGFLITGILYDTQSDPRYYRNFYVRRVLRILPPFYFLALIYLVLTPLVGAHWRWIHLSYLFYLGFPFALIWPTLMQVSPFVLTTHLWSLCAEEQFYLIWPWMIARLRDSAAVLRACAIAGVLAVLFRIAIWGSNWLSIAWTHDFLVSRMDTLALGAAIAILIRGRLQQHILKWAPLTFVLAAGGVVLMCAARHTVNHSDPVIATIGFSVIALAYAAMLVLALRPGSWVEWFLSLKLLRIFGKYSYGMYLYDLPLTVLLSPRREFFIARTHSYAIGSDRFSGFLPCAKSVGSGSELSSARVADYAAKIAVQIRLDPAGLEQRSRRPGGKPRAVLTSNQLPDASRKYLERTEPRLSKCVPTIPRWSPGTVAHSNSATRFFQTATGSSGKSVRISALTNFILPE